MLSKISAFVSTVKAKAKGVAPAAIGGSVAAAGAVFSTFAADPITVSTAVTTDMISPIVDIVVENISVIMPVGIAIMGVMIGLRLVPRIIQTFLG